MHMHMSVGPCTSQSSHAHAYIVKNMHSYIYMHTYFHTNARTIRRQTLLTHKLQASARINKNKDVLYAILQDEVFWNVGSNNMNRNFFDQNRLFLGFGLLTNANFRIEVGYLNHFVNPNSGADNINHTVSVSLLHNLTF